MSIAEIADAARHFASLGLIGAGGLFIVIGSLGLFRFPDFYSRTHAAGITDTLGAALTLAGFLLNCESWLVAAKIVAIALFLFFTSPTATHAIGNAAYTAGLKPWTRAGDKDS